VDVQNDVHDLADHLNIARGTVLFVGQLHELVAHFIFQMVQFMGQMQGKNPQEMINQMLTSGQLSQQQLNAIQQRAQQIAPMLNGMKNMFGF
jgi:ABC-type uncharacterized transport system ATPase subunit